MAICQAHKLPKTHLESVTGKGDRSVRKVSYDRACGGRGQVTTSMTGHSRGAIIHHGPTYESLFRCLRNHSRNQIVAVLKRGEAGLTTRGCTVRTASVSKPTAAGMRNTADFGQPPVRRGRVYGE